MELSYECSLENVDRSKIGRSVNSQLLQNRLDSCSSAYGHKASPCVLQISIALAHSELFSNRWQSCKGPKPHESSFDSRL